MSASLVGSEMCIRDRRCTLRPPLGAQRDTAIGQLPLELVDLGSPGWPPSVSYTHLTLPTICSV
eukprot:8490028-Alexandrium_andersonii.AAC.1